MKSYLAKDDFHAIFPVVFFAASVTFRHFSKDADRHFFLSRLRCPFFCPLSRCVLLLPQRYNEREGEEKGTIAIRNEKKRNIAPRKKEDTMSKGWEGEEVEEHSRKRKKVPINGLLRKMAKLQNALKRLRNCWEALVIYDKTIVKVYCLLSQGWKQHFVQPILYLKSSNTLKELHLHNFGDMFKKHSLECLWRQLYLRGRWTAEKIWMLKTRAALEQEPRYVFFQKVCANYIFIILQELL